MVRYLTSRWAFRRLVSAAGAAGLGAKVAMIERRLLGGDCLNYGCVPSKAVIRAARSWQDARRSADRFGGPRVEGDGDFEYRVTKNSVLRFASADSDMAAMSEHLQGPTAVALSYGDPVGLAKILSDFAEDHEVFEIKGGVLEGEAVGPGDIAKLATLPSLDALRGKLVGLLQAPATKLVRLLSEPGGQIARVVAAKGRGEGAE